MRIALFSLFTIFTLLQTANAGEFERLQALRNTEYLQVQAKDIGRPFHIYVMLPDAYGEDSERRYPTIYLLDGGGLLPMLGAYHRYLRTLDETPEAIIVGISYGSLDYGNGNYRSTDFTAPSDQRENWGGAEQFRDFLSGELLPAIEGKYRSEPSQRIIFGHSLGGQFVLFTAQTRPALFAGYIASNPALHRNLEFFLTTAPVQRTSSRLFVGNGTQDSEVFRVPALQWTKHWNSLEETSWVLQTMDLAGHTHMSAPPAAFWQGLNWIYAVDSSD